MSAEDESLPSGLDAVNLVLNRMRLAAFLAEFAQDKDVLDLLSLDVMGAAAGIPLSSTGLSEDTAGLAARPFRIWEYVWLYKALKLSTGGRRVLDLGGPATHLTVLAALAGCQVTTIDINPLFVQAARERAEALHLETLDARQGDMRDLSALSAESVDVVVSCSVLEHLAVADQETAVREMARVLRPGGAIGLTFDFGSGAGGANEHLPPPHEPPPSSVEALRRCVQPGLTLAGNPFVEDPISGSLFRHESVAYTVASLFLGKAPLEEICAPRPESGTPLVNRLRVENMPYRLFKSRQAMNELRDRAAVMEQAAAERLALIRQLDEAVTGLRAELDDPSVWKFLKRRLRRK